MNRILKILCGVACAFVFCFLAIGYAAVQDELLVTGSVSIEGPKKKIIHHQDIGAYSLNGSALTILESYQDSSGKNYLISGIAPYGFAGRASDGSEGTPTAAYGDAHDIVNVNIPASIESIGEYAFCDCPNITTFDVVAENNHYASADGVLFSKSQDRLIRFPPNKLNKALNTSPFYCIPDSVTTIDNCAFCNLPAGATIIAKEKFGNNNNWGATSACLILEAPDHYNAIQKVSGDSENGYTLTCDNSFVNKNIVFVNGNTKKWMTIDDNAQFTVPSDLCNPTNPSAVKVSAVVGDINIDQLNADINDDGQAIIGGGEWSHIGDDHNETPNIVGIRLEVNDGIFIDDTAFFYYPQNATITINGGYFETYVLVLFSTDTSTIKITGGEFKLSYGFDIDELGETLKISGGVFSIDPSPYLVQGHIAVQRDDGMWEVVDATNAALVNEEETTICSCETKCADLNDACEVCKTDISLCKGAEDTQPETVTEETTTPPAETQTPGGQNASESEKPSEPVVSSDPAILPSEDEEDGEEQPQDTENDQQGQE